MMLAYTAELTEDDNDTLMVTCPTLPEVATFGDDRDDALRHAVGAIEEALAARVAYGEDIPVEAKPRGTVVRVPLQSTLKVALYLSCRKAGVTRAELARRLHWHREQVDRLFRFDHASRLDQFDAAFAAVGQAVTIELQAA